MLVPAAISSTGTVSAYLWEPEPDEKHLNNRTATLSVVGSDHAITYQYNVTGQNEFDPQSIAMSSTLSNSSTYTVGAVMGSINHVFDYNVHTQQGTVVWSSDGLETDVAVSGQGNYFAITSQGGNRVSVYERNSKGFAIIDTIDPPTSSVQPMTLVFDRNEDDRLPFLVVAWTDQDGATLAVTTHQIVAAGGAAGSAAVEKVWSYSYTCPNGGGFNYVMQTGLAVSGSGELVAVGTWGCQNDTPRQQGVVLTFEGRKGDGTVTFQDSLKGQIWAIGCAVDVAKKVSYVSVGSWESADKSTPAQVTTYLGSQRS